MDHCFQMLRLKMIRETELFLERHLNKVEGRHMPYRLRSDQLTSLRDWTLTTQYCRLTVATAVRVLNRM